MSGVNELSFGYSAACVRLSISNDATNERTSERRLESHGGSLETRLPLLFAMRAELVTLSATGGAKSGCSSVQLFTTAALSNAFHSNKFCSSMVDIVLIRLIIALIDT